MSAHKKRRPQLAAKFANSTAERRHSFINEPHRPQVDEARHRRPSGLPIWVIWSLTRSGVHYLHNPHKVNLNQRLRQHLLVHRQVPFLLISFFYTDSVHLIDDNSYHTHPILKLVCGGQGKDTARKGVLRWVLFFLFFFFSL